MRPGLRKQEERNCGLTSSPQGLGRPQPPGLLALVRTRQEDRVHYECYPKIKDLVSSRKQPSSAVSETAKT